LTVVFTCVLIINLLHFLQHHLPITTEKIEESKDKINFTFKPCQLSNVSLMLCHSGDTDRLWLVWPGRLEYNHWSSIYCVVGWNTITGQVYIVWLVGIQSLVKYILCGWLEQDCWSSVLSCRLEHWWSLLSCL
jgi:hypothetical protein